jgi:hypothetical protein
MSAEILDFARKSKFRRERFGDIEPRPSRWRVKGVLPRQGVAFIVGQSRSGKTFVALDAALKLAAGAATVWGRRASPCGVLYCAAEDPEGCRSRIKAWRLAKHRESPMAFELIGQGFSLLDPDDAADLRATVRDAAIDMEVDDQELGVVVIDTLSRAIPGVDENSSPDMSRAFSVLADIAEEQQLLVIVVAHFGKSGAERGIRGWSGLDANSDATVTIERDADDPDLRAMTFAKVKNGVDGGRLSFRLEKVDLGTIDEDGDAETSCVPAFEPAGEARTKPRRARALTAPEHLVLAAVRYVTDHGETHPLPATAEGSKDWQRAVRRQDVKARAIENGLAGDAKPDTVLKRFNRALEGLSASRKARVEGDLIWLA